MVSNAILKEIQQEEDLEFMAVVGVKDKRSWVKAVPNDDNPIQFSIAVMSAMEALCDITGMTMQEWCDMALKLHNQKAIANVDTLVSDETKNLLKNVF